MDDRTLPQHLSRQTYDAVIFDLDGVITRTARTHATAWKRVFDDFLQERAAMSGEDHRPFDEEDYRRYVDGKPRYDGVQSFLAARGIRLPYGSPDDPPDRDTVCGLGNRKNGLFLKLVSEQGVEVFPSTIGFIRALRERGFRTAVVSSSKSTVPILKAAGIAGLFDAKIDGVDAAALGLRGKPAPDTFLEAARRLHVDPARAVVIEDAIAGVEAGHRGHFAVIGVDRGGEPQALKRAGADVVVPDLAEIEIED